MAQFTGTLDKCKACDKKVYFVDLLTADGVIYHKTCFKCVHCKGLLVMSNYSSFDGVLYCKTHFEQLFKESGTFTKYFQAAVSSPRENLKPPSRQSSMFSGTIDKCKICSKLVYPLEKMTMEGEIFHKGCFRCAHGGCPLTHFSYASLEGVLYCRHHFAQLFMEKGNFAHVLEAASLRKLALEQQQQQPLTPSKSSPALLEGIEEPQPEEEQQEQQEEEEEKSKEEEEDDEQQARGNE